MKCWLIFDGGRRPALPGESYATVRGSCHACGVVIGNAGLAPDDTERREDEAVLTYGRARVYTEVPR